MKKYIIATIIILLVSMIISSCIFEVHALGLGDPNKYIQPDGDGDNTAAVSIGNTIVWLVRTIGSAISIVMLSILGIKYLMGSVAEKAEYKQTMWPYIVGALLIFAGSNITSIIYKMLNP